MGTQNLQPPADRIELDRAQYLYLKQMTADMGLLTSYIYQLEEALKAFMPEQEEGKAVGFTQIMTHLSLNLGKINKAAPKILEKVQAMMKLCQKYQALIPKDHGGSS